MHEFVFDLLPVPTEVQELSPGYGHLYQWLTEDRGMDQDSAISIVSSIWEYHGIAEKTTDKKLVMSIGASADDTLAKPKIFIRLYTTDQEVLQDRILERMLRSLIRGTVERTHREEASFEFAFTDDLPSFNTDKEIHLGVIGRTEESQQQLRDTFNRGWEFAREHPEESAAYELLMSLPNLSEEEQDAAIERIHELTNV